MSELRSSFRATRSATAWVLLLAVTAGLAAAEGELDSSFGSGGISRTSFFTYSSAESGGSIALQDDGKIVVAGHTFRSGSTSITDIAVGRTFADGSVDTGFGREGGLVRDLGGDETTRLVRVRPDGAVIVAGDNEFGAWLLALDRFGQPLVGFGDGGAVQRFFKADAEPRVIDIAFDEQNRIVMIGQEDRLTTSPPQHISVMRFAADGTPDDAFGIKKLKVPGMSGGDFLFGSEVQVAEGAAPDIVIGGYWRKQDTRGGNPNEVEAVLMRLNDDGSLDAGFAGDGILTFHAYQTDDPQRSTVVKHLLIEDDGDLLVLGSAFKDPVGLNATTGPTEVFLAKIGSDGAFDQTFGNAGRVLVTDPESGDALELGFIRTDRCALMPVDAGAVDIYTGAVIWRLDRGSGERTAIIAEGLTDNGFSPEGEVADVLTMTNDIIPVTDGYIFSGRSRIVSADWGVIDLAVVKIDNDGRRVVSFGSDGVSAVPIPIPSQDGVTALVRDNQGRYVVGGAGERDNQPWAAITRFNTDGTRDQDFGRRGQRFWNWQPYDDGGHPEALYSSKLHLTDESYVGDLFITDDDKILVGGGYERDKEAWPDRGTGLAQFTESGAPDTSVLDEIGFRGAKTHSTRDRQPGSGREWPWFYAGPDTDLGVQNVGAPQHAHTISQVVVDGEKRILVSGEYQGWQFHSRDGFTAKRGEDYRNLYMARFHLDGTLDDSFGNSEPKDGVWRYATPIDERNPDFTKGERQTWGLDWVHDGADTLLDHHILPNGDILAVGQMGNDPNFHTRAVLLKLDQSGDLVESFGDSATPGRVLLAVQEDGINFFTAMAVDGEGRIVAAGIRRLTSYNNDGDDVRASRQPFVARFTADGQLDESFGSDGIQLVDLPVDENHVGGLVLQADGRILIAGSSGINTVVKIPPYQSSSATEASPWLVRLPADGGDPDLQRVYDAQDLDRCMGLSLSADGRRAILACDGLNQVALMAVQITDAPDPNRAPVIAQGDAVTVTMDRNGSPRAFDLTLEASDADGDTLTWSIGQEAARGTASVSGTGTSKAIDYTPPTNATGSDSFTVVVSDGSRTDSITISVVIEDPALPELDIIRGGTTILDGGSDVLSGTVAGDASLARYVLVNNGTAELTFSGDPRVRIASSSNCLVAVGSQPPASLATGISFEVPVTVTPDADGAWSCTLRVSSNDADEGDYRWTLRGTASAAPEPDLTVLRDGAVVAAGSTDDIGATDAKITTLVRYSLRNNGSEDLQLDGDVVVDQEDNCTVAIETQPATTIGVGSTGLFDVEVTPDDAEPWSFQVTVVSDDPDTASYVWTVSSEGSQDDGNQPPRITEGSAVEVEMDKNGTPRPFALSLGASDADGDPLTWSISTEAQHGTASVDETGESVIVDYQPDTDYVGDDSFVVTVSDGSEQATITVQVTVVEPTAFGRPIRRVQIRMMGENIVIEIDPADGERADTEDMAVFEGLYELQDYLIGFVEMLSDG